MAQNNYISNQTKDRSHLYNLLHPHGENAICPRQLDNYKPGENLGSAYYCPYSEHPYCTDDAPRCRPILNRSGNQRVQNMSVPRVNLTEANSLANQRYDQLLPSNNTCPRQRSGYKPVGGLSYDCPISGKCSVHDRFYVPRSSISTGSAIPRSQQSSILVRSRSANISENRRLQNVAIPKIIVNEATCSQKQSPDRSSRPFRSKSGTGNQGHIGGLNFNRSCTTNVGKQSPVRRQREQRRNINVAEMANIVSECSQIDLFSNILPTGQNQRRSSSRNITTTANPEPQFLSPTNQPQGVCPNLNQRRSSRRVRNENRRSQPSSASDFLGCQAERRESDISRQNRPPSGPPSPSGSNAGDACKRQGNRAACKNRKIYPQLLRPTKKSKKKTEFTLTDEQKALVLDSYYPGLIHDAVNQKADFNEIAKKFVTPETAVDGNKAEKGMSLIEAFDTRFKYEQINLTKLLGKIPETVGKAKRGTKPYKPVYGPLAHPVVSDILFEDNVRATAIPIDLQQYMRTKPESDPIRAISCLTRAQQLNDYYKEYKAAQAAAHLAPRDKIEEAALQGVKSFIIDSIAAETKTVETGNYKALELVSYVGITKPD